MKNIGFYFKSKHDFERNLQFLGALLDRHAIYIIYGDNFEDLKSFDKRFFWISSRDNHIFEREISFDFLLFDDVKFFIKNTLIIKFFESSGRVSMRLPLTLRLPFIFLFRKIMGICIKSKKSHFGELIYSPRGVDYKTDYPSFSELCLFDSFLIFGPIDFALLKSNKVKKVYARSYFYLNPVEEYAVCPPVVRPRRLVYMPTYFHNSDPDFEIKNANAFAAHADGDLMRVYRPHPNFIKSWSKKQKVDLESLNVLVHRGPVDTIFNHENVVLCDLSSSFFTCIALDLLVFVPQIEGEQRKNINNSLLRAITPYLPLFILKASCISDCAGLIPTLLKDETFLGQQRDARMLLRKIIFSREDLNVASFADE